jgi:hypothetical protein
VPGTTIDRELSPRSEERREFVMAKRAPHLMRLLSAAILALISIHSTAWAWEPSSTAKGELQEYLSKLESEKSSVFTSSCLLSERLKAVVIFKVGDQNGRFLLINDRVVGGYAFSATHGSVSIESEEPTLLMDKIYDSVGENVFRRNVLELLHLPFSLLNSYQLDGIFKDSSKAMC